MGIAPAQYKATQRGLTAVFMEAARNATPYYPTVCTVRPSFGKDEGYALLGSVKGMREWIGDREFAQLTAADFVLANKLWENSLKMEKTDVDDDRVGVYAETMPDLGDESAHHPDELLFEIQATGHTLACWDGQFFYDTDHLWRDSGTQSNITTTNITTANDPTPDEIKTAFHTMLIRMLGFKRDNGKFWIRPTIGILGNLELQVPLNMYEAASKAFTQSMTIEVEPTSGNPAAVSNWTIEVPKVVCIPHLGAEGFGVDTAMYLNWLGGRLKPFLFQLRAPLEMEEKGYESIEEKWLKNMAQARYNLGFLMWMYSIKHNFT